MKCMTIRPHKVNFQHYGCWYEFPDGRGVYLAHRRRSHIHKKRYAWCIERSALEDAKAKGFYVGVVYKEAKKNMFYLTLAEDFFSEHSFTNPDNILQRGLPLGKFRITPELIAENVSRKMRIR